MRTRSRSRRTAPSPRHGAAAAAPRGRREATPFSLSASAPSAPSAPEAPASFDQALTSPPLTVRSHGIHEWEQLVPEVSSTPEPTHSKRRRSAGRNLPAAITVGVLLGLIALSSIYVLPLMFTPLVAIAVLIASLEVTNALQGANLRVPAIPLLVASVGLVISAAVYGADGLLAATAIAVIVLILWRVLEATGLMAVRDTVASIFTLVWVPFLASFTVLLMAQEHGPHKILLALAVPIANDVGGYIVGVLVGKHPMARTISPKKSWEGFFGSMLAGVGASIAIGHYLLEGIPPWAAAVAGVIMVMVATIGDLCESLLKRDLGIKDMGSLLPGHGGLMDRIDSMLLTAPTLFILVALWEAFGV